MCIKCWLDAFATNERDQQAALCTNCHKFLSAETVRFVCMHETISEEDRASYETMMRKLIENAHEIVPD